MKVTNIKLSFLFEKNLFRNINSKVIWKNDNIFYTVYQHRKNLLNITGIKTKSEIDEQKVAMQKLFHQKVLKVRTYFSLRKTLIILICPYFIII